MFCVRNRCYLVYEGHMESQNEQENKAWKVQRTENEGQHGFNSQQHRKLGQSSCGDGGKPFGADRTICQRVDRGHSTGPGEISGGILRQLISRSRDRLAKLEEQVKAEIDEIQLLESALKRLKSLSGESEDE